MIKIKRKKKIDFKQYATFSGLWKKKKKKELKSIWN